MTPAERNMAKADAPSPYPRITPVLLCDRVRFRGTVEQITGHKLRAYMSTIDTRADVAAEFFYLEPGS